MPLLQHNNQQPEIVDVMDEMHNIMDRFFTRLENTGSVSNTNMIKIVALSLIDDYKDEMILCNSSYRRILSDLENQLSNIQC